MGAWASQVAPVVKNLPANAGGAGDPGVIPASGRSSGGGNGNSIPVFVPGRLYGQRSLVGYSPRGCKESDQTVTEHARVWDLSSLTRDQTHNSCFERQILNHWTTREVPNLSFLMATKYQIRSDQSLSRVRLFVDPMNRSTPGLLVHHQLLEFTTKYTMV